MIAWFTALASAQDRDQCSTDDAFPIAGTAGFENALAALRTNASTYSASSFLERTGLRRLALSDEKQAVTVQLEGNFAFGATRVPVWQEDATYGDCPEQFLLVSRPLDLHAWNFAVAGRYGRVGAFYSASMTAGYMADVAFLRPLQAYGMLAAAPFLLASAPATGQTQVGASAVAQDFVAGVVVDAEIANLRGGYTQSRGWYLSGTDALVGAVFGTIVLRDGVKVVGQFRGGVEQLPLPEAVEDKIGRPSLFLRVLPLTEAPDPDEPPPVAGAEAPKQLDLTTGHVEEHDLFRLVDVKFGYAFRPVPQVYNASVAIHDRKYWVAPDPTAPVGKTFKETARFYAEAGIVTVQPQYYYGVSGGVVPHLRAELAGGLPAASEQKGSRAAITLLLNDPEQTALYPFAVNTVSVKTELRGAW